jgi:gliding motility-associated-like protein
VNITFGAGPNPGPQITAASTNYTFINIDCPKDGSYAIRNRTENCFDTTWFTVSDHTGDPNGYFMLVNASYAPGDFYLDTVRGLCPGSTYEFASWVINVKKPVLCWGATQIIDPNITFRIERMDGTLIQSYNTNSISASTPPQWRQYGFFFTTPPGVTDVILRMVNNAPGGCGNDLGLDDITFRPCGPQINSSIVGANSNSDTLCGGVSRAYTFTAQSSPGYINPTYQWQKNVNGNWNDIPGATSTTYTETFPSTTAAGSYMFRVNTAEAGNIGSPKCRVSSQVLSVYVTEVPSLTVSSNSPVCEGGTINLSATSSDNSITWSGPAAFTASGSNVSVANAQANNAGRYIATVTKGSCTWSDSVDVVLAAKPTVQLSRDSATICEGDSIQLSATGANSYQWMPATGVSDRTSTSVFIKPASSATYSVIGTNDQGCTDTAFAFIRVNQKPVANAGTDRFILKGTSTQLSATATGDSISYYWSPDHAITGTQSLNPTVSPLVDTSYIFHVVSTAGCGADQDTVRVTIYKEIIIPNAFSPNGDNYNDRWEIPGLNSYPLAEVFLFDRYGREVFRVRNYKPWDGTKSGQPIPAATYYYVIDLRDGSPKLNGWLQLLR